MTYCKEFFHKFEKDGNFCGLDRSQESRINGYMEIVKLLEKQNIPEDQIFKRFTVKAAEPLISAKDEARTKGLNYVTSRLMDGEKITNGDLQSSFKSWGYGKQKKSCINATPPTESKIESCTNATTMPPLPVEIPAAPVAQTLKERYTIKEEPSPLVGLAPLSPDAPFSEVQKRDALLMEWATKPSVNQPEQFHTEDGLGNKIIRPPAYKIKPSVLSNVEREGMLDALLDRTDFTPKDVEVFDDIVKAGGYSCRFDLLSDMIKKLEAP